MPAIMRRLLILLLGVACLACGPVSAGQKRSASAKAEFRRLNPCPATGDTKGPCRGYVIDHIDALACGGADRPENMQWQTVAEGKAKDRWERKGCGR